MYKRVINPLVADYMVKASKNLFNAVQSGDPELAEATMVNLRATLDSYIQAIREGS
jgi:hypothetical protein